MMIDLMNIKMALDDMDRDRNKRLTYIANELYAVLHPEISPLIPSMDGLRVVNGDDDIKLHIHFKDHCPTYDDSELLRHEVPHIMARLFNGMQAEYRISTYVHECTIIIHVKETE